MFYKNIKNNYNFSQHTKSGPPPPGGAAARQSAFFAKSPYSLRVESVAFSPLMLHSLA